MAGLLLLPIFLILFWVMIVLPQKRMRQAHEALVATLEPGQTIMTTAGLFGTITDIDGEIAHVEISPGVVVRIDKRSVGAVIEGEQSSGLSQSDLAAAFGGEQADSPGESGSDDQRDS